MEQSEGPASPLVPPTSWSSSAQQGLRKTLVHSNFTPLIFSLLKSRKPSTDFPNRKIEVVQFSAASVWRLGQWGLYWPKHTRNQTASTTSEMSVIAFLGYWKVKTAAVLCKHSLYWLQDSQVPEAPLIFPLFDRRSCTRSPTSDWTVALLPGSHAAKLAQTRRYI